MRRPVAVLLTEVSIAGDRYRSASLSLLRDAWMEACNDLGIKIYEEEEDRLKKHNDGNAMLLLNGGSLMESLRVGDEIIQSRSRDTAAAAGVLVVTGSLHIVSSVLCSL